MKLIGIKQVDGTHTVVNAEHITHIDALPGVSRIFFDVAIKYNDDSWGQSYIDTREEPSSILQRMGMGLVLK